MLKENRITKYLLVVFILCTFFSCKKEQVTYHRIKYELVFIDVPPSGYTNWYTVNASPNYINENTYNYDVDVPALSTEVAEINRYWDYEYWELVNGDEVSFGCSAAPQNYYEMRVYIDDIVVSYKKIYNSTVLEESGIHDTSCFTCDGTLITFTYSE